MNYSDHGLFQGTLPLFSWKSWRK